MLSLFVLLFALPSVFSIELILFENWPMAQNICGTAINEAKAAGQCTTKDITINLQPGCQGDTSVKSAAYAINTIATQSSNIYNFVFVGPSCSLDMRTLGDFAELWKSPVIGYEPLFEVRGNEELTSVINVAQFSIGGVAETLKHLLEELNETDITLIGSIKLMPNGLSSAIDLKSYNTKMKIFNIKDFHLIDENNVDWSDIEDKLKVGARTIVICADFYDIYGSLYNIGIRQLAAFRFYIIIILSKPADEALSFANSKNLLHGANAFIIAPLQPTPNNSYEMMQEIVPNMADEKFTSFLRLYQACYTYCIGSINGVETETTNYHNAMRGKVVSTKFGTLTFDEKGSVLTDYGVYAVDPAHMTFVTIMNLKSSPNSCDTYNCFQLTTEKKADLLWSLRDLQPPAECVSKNSCTNYVPHIIAAIVIFVVFILAIILIYKQRSHRLNVYKLAWKIPRDSLKIIANKNKSNDSKTRNENFDQRIRNGDEEDEKSRREKEANESAMKMIAKRRQFAYYALVGTQRAEPLTLKQIRQINFTEKDLGFLYKLKQLQHDNLSKFLGIQCNDMENFTVLHGLIERGTLEEFCLDMELTTSMTDTYKSAFMRDIIKGLQYIHKSPIKYHGFLMASTCLIDINWVLKITLYGVATLISDNLDAGTIIEFANNDVPAILSFEQYICFPPEHIRQHDEDGSKMPRVVRGSPQGDIYNLAMIFHIMVENSEPYHRQVATDRKNLLNSILNENKMPDCDVANESERKLMMFCRECWNRDPNARPTLRQVLKMVDATYPDKTGNLVDQLIKMNEKNAEELELKVAAKTADLAEAQLQTMRLLNEMLPASIATDLKNNIIRPPQSYPSATVMFVQICEFNSLMKKSSPDQVIGFLNDIFDQFDTVIKQHDAYKVETTGETYMVASGVPEENDGRHIFEIAEISLKIREISYAYTLFYDKNYKLRIRIGFHAGPIAAGVIGIRSPRYCLFGDTVNFASRMQSNCPPNQIQTSEITARLLFESHEYKLVKRGIVHVKGKGEVNCYWLNEHIHEDHPNYDGASSSATTNPLEVTNFLK